MLEVILAVSKICKPKKYFKTPVLAVHSCIFFHSQKGLTTWSTWTTCSRTCGGGSLVRERNCTDTDTNEVIDPSNCGEGTETNETQECNADLCAGKICDLC